MVYESQHLNSEVENTIKKIETVEKKSGSSAAYNALKKEYDAFVNNPKHSSSDDATYLRDITSGLHNKLDDLSVAWGLDKLAQTKSNSLDSKSIIDAGNNNGDTHSLNLAEFDRVMARHLVKQFKDGMLPESQSQIGKLCQYVFGGESSNYKYLSKENLETAITKNDQEIKQETPNSLASANVFASYNGLLFNVMLADKNQNEKGAKSTYLNKQDIVNFIKSYNTNPESAMSDSLEPGQVAALTDLVNNWDSPNFELLHPNGVITADFVKNHLIPMSIMGQGMYPNPMSMMGQGMYPNPMPTGQGMNPMEMMAPADDPKDLRITLKYLEDNTVNPYSGYAGGSYPSPGLDQPNPYMSKSNPDEP